MFNNFKYNKNTEINILHNNYINVIDILKKNNNSINYVINELNLLFNINNKNNNIIIFKFFINLVHSFFYKNYLLEHNKDILLFQEIITFQNQNLYDIINTTNDVYNEFKEELDEKEQKKYDEAVYSNNERDEALDYEISSDAESEFGENEELIQDFD